MKQGWMLCDMFINFENEFYVILVANGNEGKGFLGNEFWIRGIKVII